MAYQRADMPNQLRIPFIKTIKRSPEAWEELPGGDLWCEVILPTHDGPTEIIIPAKDWEWEEKSESKLKAGLVPAFTLCPYEDSCCLSQGRGCNHKGTAHEFEFSCAIARGLDLIHRKGL